jgi:hypothetical protein
MMTSITPVGEMARQQRWWLTTTAYLVGSLAGGLAVGTLLGAVSVAVRAVVPTTAAVALLAAAAVAGLLADTGRLPLPSWRRQVDERWLTTYRGWVYGAGFGLQLGSGVATIVTSSVTYVVLAAAVLSGSVLAGAAIGATYGLVRALPVLAFARVRTPGRLRKAMRRVDAWRDPAARVATAAQGAVALAAVTVLLTGSV